MSLISFRADGGPGTLGMGHIVRSSAIATELMKRGEQVQFITKRLDGSALGFLDEAGFEVIVLEDSEVFPLEHAKASSLVVLDAYDISAEFLAELKGLSKLALLADYPLGFRLSVDVLINPQPGADKLGYNLEQGASLLAGAEYTIFRTQFLSRETLVPKDCGDSLLLFFGGADKRGLTLRVCESLSNESDLQLKVLLGGPFPDSEERKLKACFEKASYKAELFRDVQDVASLVSSVDAVCCTPSSIATESCVLGQVVGTILAERNQEQTFAGLSQAKAILPLGTHQDVTDESILRDVKRILQDTELRKRLSINAKTVFDGKGVSRICDKLQEIVANC